MRLLRLQSAPDNLQSGVHPVSFYYEDGQIVNKTFEFKSANDMSSDYKQLSQVKDATEVRQIVEQHGEEWDFDFSLYNILQEDAKKEVVNRFIALNGTKTDRITKAAEIFKDAVMVVAISAYQGDFSDLVTGVYGDYTGFAGAAAYEQMNAYLDSKSCKYPNSTKKIAFMMRRYEEDGFTSYWL